MIPKISSYVIPLVLQFNKWVPVKNLVLNYDELLNSRYNLYFLTLYRRNILFYHRLILKLKIWVKQNFIIKRQILK